MFFFWRNIHKNYIKTYKKTYIFLLIINTNIYMYVKIHTYIHIYAHAPAQIYAIARARNGVTICNLVLKIKQNMYVFLYAVMYVFM